MLTYGSSFDVFRHRISPCISSLVDSRFPGQIVIVDDGSRDRLFNRHLDDLGESGPPITLLRRPSRGGVARAKNTCLRALAESGFDFGFIAEDDVLFTRDWWIPYYEAYKATGYHHFNWSFRQPYQAIKINGHEVLSTERLHGCLMTVTPTIVRNVGGFPILRHPWGHEHTNWTRRIIAANLAPGFCDIRERFRVRMHPERTDKYTAFSIEKKIQFAEENAEEAAILEPIYRPLVE